MYLENALTSLVTLAPNSQPAPLGLIAQVSTSSGSDQTRSQNAPLWGISWLRSMVRIWSKVLMSGERPPCTQRICSSINCGRNQNITISTAEGKYMLNSYKVQNSIFNPRVFILFLSITYCKHISSKHFMLNLSTSYTNIYYRHNG